MCWIYAKNQLTGGIPDAIGSLSQLRMLDLDTNQLSGDIPSSLGNLSQLKHLWLHSNLFSGPIPASLGNMSQLQILDLCCNKLSGAIPDAIGSLSQLQRLDLYANRLNGSIPDVVGRLSRLERLHLFLNELGGTIPVSLGNLTQLKRLGLDSNRLTGAIPDSLSNLLNLQRLYLDSNQLTGPIPAALLKLRSLQVLDLHSNQLSGAVPEEVCTSSIQQLLLSRNMLTDLPFPCNATSLVAVDLSSNRLRQFPLKEALTWPVLLSLYLSRNQLDGDFPLIPPVLSLRTLSLANNRFAGNFPIGPCGGFASAFYTNSSYGLSYLDVSGNNISRFFFGDRNSMQSCSNPYSTLSTLLMSGCGLRAHSVDPTYMREVLAPTPICMFLFLFDSLQTLDLSFNNLAGALDDAFELADLIALDLRGNPSATQNITLSPSLRSDVVFDASSLYPYSDEMTCYQAKFGETVAMHVDPTFFNYPSCQCHTGFYGKPPSCQPCSSSLQNVLCSFLPSVDVSTIATNVSMSQSGNVLAVAGYYASPAVSYAEQMQSISSPAVIEQCHITVPSLSPCHATENGPCVKGHAGRLCAGCSAGYFASGDRCWTCPSAGGLAGFGVLLVVVVLAFVAWSFALGGGGSGLFKIFLFFLQGLAYTRAPMPDSLYLTSNSSSSLSVFPVVGPECFFFLAIGPLPSSTL